MRKNSASLIIICLFPFLLQAHGYYMEYNVKSQKGKGNIKLSISDCCNKAESVVKNDTGNVLNTVLVRTDTTTHVYFVDPLSKSYYEASLNDYLAPEDPTQKVVIIGQETIGSYKCTHVAFQSANNTRKIDIWLTTDVADPELYAKMITAISIDRESLFKKLSLQSINGLVVRILISSDNKVEWILDLVKFQKKSLDNSSFSLDGYQASNSNTSNPNTQVDTHPLNDSEKKDIFKKLENPNLNEQK